MRNFIVFVVLVLAFYVLLEDKGTGQSQIAGENTQAIQSEFENGLPSSYLPQDFSRLTSIKSLKADLKYRREKLENQFEAELKDARDNQELKRRLRIQHSKAREEFGQKQTELKKKMLEDEKYYKDRGLR